MGAPGEDQYQALLKGGFSANDANGWKVDQTAKLRSGGFTQPQIDNYWGDGAPKGQGPENLVAGNMQKNWDPSQAHTATNPLEMVAAGFDMSSASLAVRPPQTVAPKDAGLFGKIAYGVGQFAGDLPTMYAGAAGGGVAGAAAGSETGPGAAVTGVLGAGAGMAALPEAVRQVMMDHYEHNADKNITWSDIMSRSAKVAWNTAKAAVVGGVSMGIGGKVGSAVLDATGSEAASTIASNTTYAASATAVGGALDGRVPDSSDFVSSLVLLGGAHVAGLLVGGKPTAEGEKVASNMRATYAKTGVPPWEQAQRAAQDPVYRQELLGKNASNDTVSTNFARDKPEEPPPFKKPEEANPFQFVDFADNPKRMKGEDLDTTPSLVVARQMPDGTIRYGQPGEIHIDLMEPNDYATGRSGDDSLNGFAVPGGKFMDRGEALQWVKNNQPDIAKQHGQLSDYGLEAVTYKYAEERARPGFQTPDEIQPLVERLETGGLPHPDTQVSATGAVSRYQIEPATAVQYGFDPKRVASDPEHAAKANKAILGDLTKRFRNADGSVDVESVLIAYNAGPGRAIAFRADGRNFDKLPNETKGYLLHAERITGGAGMGGKGPPPPPEGPPVPAGEPAPGPLDLTPEMLTDRINDVIANPVKPSILDKTRDLFRNLNYEAISELAPAERMDRALDVPEDALGVSGMFRQVYGSAGRAWLMLHDGPLNPMDPSRPNEVVRTEGPALMDAYKSAMDKNGSIDEFKAYRQALRTVELTNSGRKSAVPVADAQALIEKLGDKYAPEMAMVRAANDGKIDYYRDSGMLSPEGAAQIKADNRDWYPQIPEKEGIAGARKGGRFGPVQVIKSAMGHERQILDPATQELKSYYTMAAVADKNRAVASLMAGLSKEQLGELGIRQIEDKSAKVDLFDKDGNLIPEALNQQTPLGNSKDVSWFENGIRKTAEVDDPQLASMIRGIAPLGGDTATNALRWFASLKRSGIVEMPDFIARTIMRHSMYAAVLSKYGGAPFANTFRGLFHVIKGDDVFKEAVANGVFASNLTDMDANYVVRDLHEMQSKGDFFGGVVNTVKHPLEAIQMIQQRLASAPRVGVYLQAKEAGLSPLRAGVEGRTSGLDYAEKGASPVLSILSGMVPFYRAGILDIKQMATAFTERPLMSSLKAMAYISAPTAALYALNYQQDKTLPDARKFANLPRWQKDTMFILPEIDGVRLRLPMPWTLGTVFGGMTNRLLDHWLQNDPKAFEDFASTVLAKAMPPVIPAAVMPIYEHMANYNSYTGRPLIPASQEKASAYAQYSPSTSETAKQIARVLGPPHLNIANVSPIIVDNYVRQWTGGMGATLMRILGAPFKDDGRPTELADSPLIGSFLVRNPGVSAQPIEDFYDEADKVEAKGAALKLAIQRQNDSLERFSESDVQSFLKMDQYRQALSQQRSAVDAIETDKKMSPAEKRQYTDTIYSGMIQTAKAGLEVMRSVK
jgi:hypothetical protein